MTVLGGFMKKIVGSLVTSLALVGLLSSCGGGGGSTGSTTGGTAGPATALTVAEKVSVVDAQSAGDSGAPARARAAVRALSLPADSDYNTDKANVYVEERSVQSFNTVNEILCMMAQTRYGNMLNQGPYKAMVDTNLCRGRDDASAGGAQSANQSSGANMPNYAIWTVDSSRADDAAPHILKVWIHEAASEHDPEKVIFAKAVITEGVSASNPYGLFTLHFDGRPVIDGVPAPQSMFRGVLMTELVDGKVMLKFFDAGNFGVESYSEAAVLDRSADGSSGGGTIRNEHSGGSGPEAVNEPGSQTTAIDIAYDSANFHRVGGGQDICLNRTQFDESAWRYGVYDANGARVARNSGFPVRLSRGGTDYHGHIGYYGPWFPDNVTLVDGETVYKQTFGPDGGTETAYQVLVAGGKLKKNTRKLLVLGDIVNIPLDFGEFDPVAGTDNQFRVMWDGTKFSKVARMNKSTWTWESLVPAVDIDLGALRWSELNFHSQALSGNVQVKLQNCAHIDGGTPFDPSDDTFSCSAGNNTPVVSYAEVVVSPTDTIPATLLCFENCPDAANLGGQNPFLPSPGYQPVPPGQATATAAYTFDSATMLLKSGQTSIVASSLGSNFQFGMMSGPLFDNTAENLGLLACEWDNNTCAWQARSNLPVYYTWETGSNNWNRLVALRSGGTFLSFDPPLQLGYTHLAAGKYQNAKFYLEYGGSGDLHGIPGKCVDLNTGADADCSQGGPGSPIRWVPEFTIPDGSSATDALSATYYLKALEKEQRMRVVAGSECSSLPVTSYASQLPGLSDWSDPAIGAEPAVAGAPAVIGGVLQ
jgi:hypothetical protein